MIPIATPRLFLRPWHPGDEAELARLADRPEIWRKLRDFFPHPYRLGDAVQWIQNSDANPTSLNLAIEREGRLLGAIGLARFSDVYRKTAEIGYWLGLEHWGQGYATEAVSGLTPWAFENWDLERIQAGIFSGNAASVRVLEKAGYHLEARLIRSVFKEGRFLDELLYVCFRPSGPEGTNASEITNPFVSE